jgi:chaperonin GroES
MSLKHKTSIFESGDQYLNYSPQDIRPLGDRVLVRDLPDQEKIDSIWLPQGHARDNGLRFGVVVAIGKGDKWLDCGWPAGKPEPVLKALADGLERLPMDVKPGDKILYDQRKEAEVFIDGERFTLIHQQQSIIGILESESEMAGCAK